MIDFYDDPAQMEPLSIDPARPAYIALTGLAHELSETSGRVDAALAPATARSLSELVAGMNCYYSNLIEGHRTLPVDIERALQRAREGDAERNLQSLARAHIEADRWARTRMLHKDSLEPFLLEVHRLFCLHLPADHLKLSDGSLMTPGEFRTQEVQVGRHLAPKAASLGRFLERYAGVFGPMLEKAGQGGIPALEGIVSSFVAHHRLVWIHPFPDGNGRVARILLDAMLRGCRVNRASLWSMSRGFAKTADEYKACLSRADEHRMGALDGRGNLSERGLAEFCTYALKTAIDQAAFMGRMFDLEQFRSRTDGFSGESASTSSRKAPISTCTPFAWARSSAAKPGGSPGSRNGLPAMSWALSCRRDCSCRIRRRGRFVPASRCTPSGRYCPTFTRRATSISPP